ncbi:MAG: hypothetical protein AAF636_11380 [Pseudomonadota bacterium]
MSKTDKVTFIVFGLMLFTFVFWVIDERSQNAAPKPESEFEQAINEYAVLDDESAHDRMLAIAQRDALKKSAEFWRKEADKIEAKGYILYAEEIRNKVSDGGYYSGPEVIGDIFQFPSEKELNREWDPFKDGGAIPLDDNPIDRFLGGDDSALGMTTEIEPQYSKEKYLAAAQNWEKEAERLRALAATAREVAESMADSTNDR